MTAPTVTKTYDGGTPDTTQAGDLTALSGSLVGGERLPPPPLPTPAKTPAPATKQPPSTPPPSTTNGGANYTVSLNGNSNSTITPAALTLAADNQSKLPGQANPQLTWKITGSGLGAGDTASSVFSGGLATDATISSQVGSYVITQGNLSVNSNYQIATFTNGILNIQKCLSASLSEHIEQRWDFYVQNSIFLSRSMASNALIDGATLLRITNTGIEFKELKVEPKREELRPTVKDDFIRLTDR